MNETEQPFAEQLIAAESRNTEAPVNYRQEIQKTLEKPLTPRQRGVYLLAAALSLLAGVFFVSVLTRAKPQHPEFVRFVVTYAAVTAAVLVVLAVGLFRTYWSGVVRQRYTHRWASRVGIAYAGIVGLMLLGAVRQTPEMLREEVRAMGWLLLLYTAAAWVRNRVTDAQMDTAEKLLEIELRVAEIREDRAPLRTDS